MPLLGLHERCEQIDGRQATDAARVAIAHDLRVVRLGVRLEDQLEHLPVGASDRFLVLPIDSPVIAEALANVCQINGGDERDPSTIFGQRSLQRLEKFVDQWDVAR